MKRVKTVLSMVLVIIIAIGGSGCMNIKLDLFKNQSEIQAEKAEQMLYEKYGKEFVVDSLGGRWGTATDGYYTCNCHPVDNESLEFQAIINKDYSSMEDQYATKMGEKAMEDYILRAISNIDPDPRVLVESSNKAIVCNDNNISFEDFVKYNNEQDIYIRILLDVEPENNSYIQKLNDILSNIDLLNGYIYIYFADSSAKEAYDVWNNSRDYDDYNCGKILTEQIKCKNRTLRIENGNVN